MTARDILIFVLRPAFFLFLLAAPVLCQTSSVIEGHVLDAVTGAPVRKAVLSLYNTQIRNAQPTETETDASGRFRFAGLPPGVYRLLTFARAYGDLNQPIRQLSLAPGQSLQALVLRLTPLGAISGRILDQDGDPVAAADVRVWHVRYDNQRMRQLATDNGDAKALTDDRGMFRIAGLAPGSYYVSASPPNRAAAANPQTARYVRTWHPAALDPVGATPIDLAPGAEQEIPKLKLSRIETVSLRGRVLAQAPANVSLCPDGLDPMGDSCTFSVSSPADGAFAFDGLVPGTYQLSGSVQGTNDAITRRSITIGSAGVDNLTLQRASLVAVEGRLRVEGADILPNLSQANIYLIPLFPSLSAMQSTIKNGVLSLPSVIIPGPYQVIATNLPPDLYFRSAAIDLPPARPPFEVVLHPNAAGITGTVLLPDSEQSVPNATILLVPQEPSRRNDLFAYVKATSDSQGRFSIQNLEPGEYKAYAWSLYWTITSNQLYLDPDFLRPFESRAQAITLGENEHPEVKLPLLSQ